jgi:hypothetical protein
VDVQSSHPGSSPHGCRFGFLLFHTQKTTVGGQKTGKQGKLNISLKIESLEI